MTDPITRAPPPVYVPPAERAAGQPVQPPPRPGSAEAHAASEPPAAKREPLTLDVARSDSGVFVYTLRDPATDVVLAVIPREDVRAGRDGQNVDRKV